MNTHLKYTALLLFIIFISLYSQSGTILFRSTPSQADVYSAKYGYLGTTPFKFTLKEPIPAAALQAGTWQHEFAVRYKNGAPIVFYPQLPITKAIRMHYQSQKDVNTCWLVNFPINTKESTFSAELVPTPPDFFACNYWIDENQDGAIAPNEWYGIKDYFRKHEQITFVAHIRQDIGVSFSYILYDPDGTIFESSMPERTTFNTSVVRYNRAVKALIENGGAGDWEMHWFIEGDLVNVTKVRLK